MAGLRYLLVIIVSFMLSDLSQEQVVNVAVGKPATQHTDLYWAEFNWTADKAVDDCLDRTDPEFSRCCSASQVMPPQKQDNYWRLNLTRQYEVERIVIYGRNRSGGLDHLSGFKLYITKDEKGIQELITEPPSEFASIYTFLFSPFRKITDIMIRRPQADDAIIVLCEVQVYAVCDSGTYGVNCSQTCGHCVDSCDTTAGSCPTGCIAGWQGDMCVQVYDDGTFGVNCSQICGYCVDICNTTDGSCPSGCLAGWRGNMCRQVCDDGTFGVNCSQICGYCVDICNTTDGSCPSGCLAGWRGNMCRQACLPNTYGWNCNMTCGNCLGRGQCDHKNGTCLMGCDTGWQGDMCVDVCPDGSYGQNCTQTCGRCFDTEVCQKTTGRCLSGCALGWSGPLCSQVQPECTPRNNNLVFILGGILAAQSFIVLGTIFFKLFKRHAKRKKKEDKEDYFTVFSRTKDRPSQAYNGESDIPTHI